MGEWRESAERGINLCEIGEFAGSRQCILQRIPSGWSRTIKLQETWVGGFDLISSNSKTLRRSKSLSMVYTGSKKSLSSSVWLSATILTLSFTSVNM